MNQLQRTEALQRHLRGETMTKLASIIDVSYVWRDLPSMVYHGRIAVADRRLTVEEFDQLMDDERVFYVFEAGERPMAHNGDFKIISMDGVV
jgi:hypothetical protein